METIQLEKQKQDEQLDAMSKTLDHLSVMAKSIHTELDEQAVIIEHIDKDIDVAQGRVERATASVKKLLKNTKKSHIALITGLIIILVVVAVIAFA